MFVRPAPGLLVRRADTLALLPEAGEDVPDHEWCQRRLRDGDVVEGAVPVPVAAPDPAPAAASPSAPLSAPAKPVAPVKGSGA